MKRFSGESRMTCDSGQCWKGCWAGEDTGGVGGVGGVGVVGPFLVPVITLRRWPGSQGSPDRSCLRDRGDICTPDSRCEVRTPYSNFVQAYGVEVAQMHPDCVEGHHRSSRYPAAACPIDKRQQSLLPSPFSLLLRVTVRAA